MANTGDTRGDTSEMSGLEGERKPEGSESQVKLTVKKFKLKQVGPLILSVKE